MHVTIAGTSLLVGDEVAGELLRYAALLGKIGSADSILVRSIGVNGEEVEAIHADALNALGPGAPEALAKAPAGRVLTPHPGEMSRSSGPRSRTSRAIGWAMHAA